MSDSFDELYGSLGPTTPVAPVKVRSSIAGPSSKPTTRANSRKRIRSSDSPEVEEIHHPAKRKEAPSEHDDDGEVVVVPLGKLGRKTVTRLGGVGVGKSKGKGKDKAISQPAEVIQSDDVVVVEDTEEPKPQRTAHVSNPAKKGKKVAAQTTKKVASRELEDMRQKPDAHEEVVKQRDALSRQLEELFRLRETDPERELQQQRLQYEARIQTQESMIKELTSQLACVEPLSRPGKSSVLHLLTREAADEEQKVLEKELARWQDTSKGKDLTISEQAKRIAELEQLGKDQQEELKMEIQRSKGLALRNTIEHQARGRAQTRPTRPSTNNPKNTQVIKLYEDLTNLLVHNVKFQPSQYLDLEESCFSCIYTYVDLEDVADEKKRKSLNLTLRFYHDLVDHSDTNPVTSLSQLREMVDYKPLELDKETEEFIEGLEFLGDSFTFKREQLPLFIDTLRRNLGDATQNGGEDEDINDD